MYNGRKNVVGKLCGSEATEAEVAERQRLEGEDLIHQQLNCYKQDSQGLAALKAFRPKTQQHLARYKLASLFRLRDRLVQDMTKHLSAIAEAESEMQLRLQRAVIDEVTAAFHEALGTRHEIKNAVFDSAIEALAHSAATEVPDPVGAYFKSCFRQLEGAETPTSPVVQCVTALHRDLENQFLDRFAVRTDEAEALRRIAGCCGKDIDLSRLTEEQRREAEQYHRTILSRLGLGAVAPYLDGPPLPRESADGAAMVQRVNRQLQDAYLQRFLRNIL